MIKISVNNRLLWKKKISMLCFVTFLMIVLVNASPIFAGEKTFKDLTPEEIANLFGEMDPQIRLYNLRSLYDTADNYSKFVILPKLSKTFIEVGNHVLAEEYANELLAISREYKGDWNYGNSIHDANIVLGMVALGKGDVDEAGDFLLKAGHTSPSPQLSVFGPNVMLAKALLEIGEREKVISYFELMKSIWQANDGRLDSWISAIKGGGMPFFDYNLYL